VLKAPYRSSYSNDQAAENGLILSAAVNAKHLSCIKVHRNRVSAAQQHSDMLIPSWIIPTGNKRREGHSTPATTRRVSLSAR
jgi:hypothetical protein